MASFGAKMPLFAPFATEPEAALPTYGETVNIGKLVKADLTVTLASGELWADDALAESLELFASGSIAMETDDIADEVASVLYGATVTEKQVDYNDGDNPPYGGLVYYKTLVRGGKPLFKGYFYPKTKAALGNDSAATKSSSVTFGTANTTLKVLRCNTGVWRRTKEFSDEAECISWCSEQLQPAASEG